MNLGKDVFTLMKEVKLPAEMPIRPYFGKVPWTIRGIYNEYAGWFDEDPASMYTIPISDVFPDLLEASGGVENILKKAEELLNRKEYVKVLHLTRIVLTTEPENAEAREIRLSALTNLKKGTYNYIERIWLDFGISELKKQLK